MPIDIMGFPFIPFNSSAPAIDFPNDPGPLVLGLSGYQTISDYKCIAVPPDESTSFWVDNDNTAAAGVWTHVIKDGADAWQFFYQGNSGLCGSAPGTANMFITNHGFAAQRRLYLGFQCKLSNPFDFPNHIPGSGSEIHTMFCNTTGPSGGGVTMDFGEQEFEWDFEMPTPLDRFFPQNLSLDVWHTFESLYNYDTGTAQAWLDGTLIRSENPTYPSDSGFYWISCSPTWGGCTPPNQCQIDSYLWIRKIRVSGHN